MPPVGHRGYPFAALVGQPGLRLALTLLAVDPRIGGLLVMGGRGTAKSTTCRSIVDLLPDVPIRTLTPGSTADRLTGAVDLAATLRSGSPHWQRGLLEEAEGGLLHLDEVNLLDDHLTDLVTTSAGAGTSVLLLATMNPDEGDLRPQLLDRFALCVAVTSEMHPADRAEIIRRRLAHDEDPAEFRARWRAATDNLRARLADARALLPQVTVGPAATDRVGALVAQAHAAGHRGDLALARAASAHAAWLGQPMVRTEDVDTVAELALRHRRRAETPPTPPPAPPSPPRERTPRPEPGPQPEKPTSKRLLPPDRTDDAAPTAVNTPPPPARDRRSRPSRGRRLRTFASDRRGHHVRSRPTTEPEDLSVEATLRAAAVHQRARHAALPAGHPRASLAILVESADWQRRVRVGRAATLVLFVVDASGSMGARGRMVASKGAVLGLLQDAYVKRDRVGLITFRGARADVVVPPTSSMTLARRRLRDLIVGGTTPLATGLARARAELRTALRRDPTLRPLVIVVTDGRGNVDLSGQRSRAATTDALSVARGLRPDGRTAWLVVDTGDPRRPSGCPALVEALGARHVTLDLLDARAVTALVATHHHPAHR